MPSRTVVVFGSTGAIGSEMIEIMSEKQPDWMIHAVSRSADSTSRLAKLRLPNVQMVQGSAEDLNDVKRLTQDADRVFCCVGFAQYERKYWAEHWPIVVDNMLAVTSNDRPLIFCDNLYAYGVATNMNPKTTPLVEANDRSKPGVRAMIHQTLQKRIDEQPRSVVAVAASDFFGPYTDDKSVLVSTILEKMVKGSTPVALTSPHNIHDFCYARDFANALYLVSTDENLPKSTGHFWICPHAIRNMTMVDIAGRIRQRLAAGKDDGDSSTTNTKSEDKPVSFQVFPYFIFYAMGWFVSIFYELREMMPIWSNDYSVDPSDFEKTFGVVATDIDVALDSAIAAIQKDIPVKESSMCSS